MKIDQGLKWILYIGLGMILFILPFPRGLFFEKEILPVQLICFALFIVWTIYKLVTKEGIKINTLLIIGVLIFPVIYLLPLILGQAASKYSTTVYIFRYVLYALVFLMISDLTKNKRILFGWLNVLGISGMVAAILGLDAASGTKILRWIDKTDGLNNIIATGGAVVWGRINGVLQYPNSFAIYMAMIFFIFLGLGLMSNRRWLKAIYGGVMVPVLITLVLTVSRGALAFVPIFYLLMIILVPSKEKRIETILLTIFPMGAVLAVIRPLNGMVEKPEMAASFWGYIIVAMVVGAVLTFLVNFVLKYLNKIPDRWYKIGIIGGISVLVIGVVVIWQTGLYEKILPEFLIQRFSQLGSAEQATSGRTNFYRDGIKIVKDHWLLGAGGGAWEALYRKYQSYSYPSSEAHSLILQLWIETGILGVLSLIFLAFSILWTYWKGRKTAYGVEITIGAIVVLLLLGHSMVDFNFSYVSLPLMAFALLGTMNGLGKEDFKTFKVPAWVGTAVGCILIIFPILFVSARVHAVKATEIIKEQKETEETVQMAIAELEKAAALDPWNVDYLVKEKVTDADLQYDLDTLYQKLAQYDQANQALVQKHLALMEKALKIEPSNPVAHIKTGSLLIRYGRFPEGLDQVSQGSALNPMAPGRYEEQAQAYLVVAQYYLQAKQEEGAKEFLEYIVNIPQEIDTVNESALEPVKITTKTTEYIEQAKKYLDAL